MTISCPREATLLGPRMREWFEFDVVVPMGDRHPPSDPSRASTRIEDAADRVAAVLMARYGGLPTATVTAVRPLSRRA
jgi:hypothetical protein